jgi:hypothetical protein
MPTPQLCLITIFTHIVPEETEQPVRETLEMEPREQISGCQFQLARL